jgi:hypothetical protein
MYFSAAQHIILLSGSQSHLGFDALNKNIEFAYHAPNELSATAIQFL